MRQEENKSALFDEVYRLLCQARPKAAIYRQIPLPDALNCLATNDEQWENKQPKQKSGHLVRLMPLIAQYLPIFGSVFRKLTQKFFSPKIPVTAAAILIFIGFAVCSTSSLAYDNMSGTPHGALKRVFKPQTDERGTASAPNLNIALVYWVLAPSPFKSIPAIKYIDSKMICKRA